MNLTWLELTICGLACLRLAILLSQDVGPYRVFEAFRRFLKREAKDHPALKKSATHVGIECLRCTSLQLSIPMAAYAMFKGSLPRWAELTGDTFVLCLALSTIAILLNRAFPAK